jgi:flagellar hook-associated protein 1 FlgK
MSNLLASLRTSADTLQAYNQVLEIAQNNVSNASTPGYAKQVAQLYARPFDPMVGTSGGVGVGQMVSTRNLYADQAVRAQETGLGYQQQMTNTLSALQASFDISGNQGIPLALNNLFQSFSAWGATPDNAAARQTVIQDATALAQTFQQTANQVTSQASNAEQQIGQTVDQINSLVGQLQGYNVLAMQGGKNDAGLSAQMNSTLDQLSSLANVTASFQSDGSVSVMLNGQSPLLLGDKQYKISSSLYQTQTPPPTNLSAPAAMRIQGSDGTDITAQTVGGQLGALLNLRNTVIPSITGDAYQPGSLNIMAKQVADRVNTLLTSGNISDGPPPVPGVALFTYDSANPTDAAASMAVDPTVTPGQLAAISIGPPEVSNGVPLALSALSNPLQAADEVNGLSYSQYFGQIAGNVGGLLSTATNGQIVQQSLVSQAQSLQQQYEGVSLDEEATILMQFQRSYEATSKFLTILDNLTEVAINMLSTT